MVKKISKDKVKEIKRLRELGFSYNKISKKVGCCYTTVVCYLSKKAREKHRKYYRERYQNDEKFRERVIACNVKNQKQYRKEGKDWKSLHPIKAKKYYKKYLKKYRQEHKEELKLKHKEYLQTPKAKEYSKKYQKEYYQKNKEKCREYYRKWYLKNKDKITEKRREYQRNNRELVNARNRADYQKNKEKRLKRKKEVYKVKKKL